MVVSYFDDYIIQATYQVYRKIIKDTFDDIRQNIEDEYLVLITTDHALAVVTVWMYIKYPFFYYDDRTMIQYNEHQVIDNNEGYMINEDRKVIILGLDGVPIEQFNESIITKEEVEENDLHQYTFDIQNYESDSVLTERSFDAITSTFKSEAPMSQKDEIDDQIKYLNEVITPSIQKSCETLLRSIEENNNLIFYYDTIADEAGHAGFGYDEYITQGTYGLYREVIQNTFETINDKYLVLITTDHGRDRNGKNHSNFFSTAHES
ncbi:hypothetical protein FQA39_LY13000 [Lamprigera yunnana]|nr:hypothetical protein FQA39_LY13000 [Lamprigera yunnana]